MYPLRNTFPTLAGWCLGAVVVLASTLASAQAVILPKPRQPPEVAMPASLGQSEDALVPLTLTVNQDGTVSEVSVEESQGDAIDQAAVAAASQWRFDPALRDGKPIAARVRVLMHLVASPPPAVTPATTESSPTDTSVPADAPPLPASSAVPAPDQPKKTEPDGIEAKTGSATTEAEAAVTVQGRARPTQHGSSDFVMPVGRLQAVPRKNASELLTLAPGIFLSNEGGAGHAERVYLRGFDAREGQDIELSVGGVPINESGNLHGNGFADLHFIIPELVHSLRVLEGPFDPHQGNYAVAGSADYELGLEKRGLTVKYSTGSFGTERLLLLFGPTDASIHSFGGVEVQKSDGFGQNRDQRLARAMGQYQGSVGKNGSFRLGAAAYGTRYHSAGVLRQDDLDQGRVGFYDTYDPRQGGDATRFHVYGDVESRSDRTTLYQQVFVIRRTMRLRENFTGFLLDQQLGRQQPHDQRGDLFDSYMDEDTLGARGFARSEGQALGLRQELELGYFARLDRVSATRQRIDADTGDPYVTDTDLSSSLGDIGLYVDGTLRLIPRVALRGGLRADLFTFDVLDRCAVKDVSRPSPDNPPGDASCLSQQRFGVYREPTERSSTSAIQTMPRASLLLGPFQSFLFSMSYGTGVRSIDPNYITEDVGTPFASISAYEGGVSYAHGWGPVGMTARSVFFVTHVDRDLIFSESEGRNLVGGGTTRTGWVGAVRVTGGHFDQSANVTLVRSTFDDTHLLVPYVPDLVVRSDSSVWTELPLRLGGQRMTGSLSAGVSYIGRRALPYGQTSHTIFTIDPGAALKWQPFELGLEVTNLLDTRYRLAEYNFVSDFHSQPAPTLVPARHFVAGPPRTVLLSLSLTLGGS